MSLTIYEMPHSPYCIPVTHALECFGISFERKVVPNWDRREIARLTDGRYYQVPLVIDGENVIHETEDDPLAVPRYLDEKHLGGALFPAAWNGMQDIVVDHIEGELESYSFKLTDIHYLNLIEDVAERTMVIRHKERLFGRGCVDQWRENAAQLKGRFEKLLHAFDLRLQQAPYLFDSVPVYADFALFGVLGNYTYQDLNALPSTLAALCAWREKFACAKLQLPS